MTKYVYLAGPIADCSYREALTWRETFSKGLPSDIITVSPLRGYNQYIKNKNTMMTKKGDNKYTMRSGKGLTMRDTHDCLTSDMIVFYLSNATVVSIGTCIELGLAHAVRKPSVLIMEEPTDTYRNIHEHAMVREICGYHVTSLDDAKELVIAMLSDDFKRTYK